MGGRDGRRGGEGERGGEEGRDGCVGGEGWVGSCVCGRYASVCVGGACAGVSAEGKGSGSADDPRAGDAKHSSVSMNYG